MITREGVNDQGPELEGQMSLNSQKCKIIVFSIIPETFGMPFEP